MIWEFIRFELRYWFRGWMVYIFFAILTAMFAAAAISDQVTVGQAIGNTYRNAPYVIQMYYGVGGILAGLMVTAFVDSAASRDFVCKFHEILFTNPLPKTSFLLGRFIGSSLAALFPLLGISLGILIAGVNPYNDPVRWGSTNLYAHAMSILVIALPNVLLYGSVVFSISVWTRSTLYAFIGSLLFLVAYAIGSIYLEQLENESIGAILEPFGMGAFSVMTKYWTVEEKNTLTVGFTGLMLQNRLIWLCVSATLVALATWRFSFSERVSRRKAKVVDERDAKAMPAWKPIVPTVYPEWRYGLSEWFAHLRNDFRGVIRSTVFVVLLVFSLINMIPSVWFNANQMYGLSTFPVTYHQVEAIRGSLLAFLVAIITFFGGVLVWRDRDARFHEILGALPQRNWPQYLSRLVSLLLIIGSILAMGIAIGVTSQLASHYDRLQWSVYFKELLGVDLLRMAFLAVVAILIHSLAPNKYIGYFGFVAFLIVNAFVWNVFRVETLLVKFGRLPSYTYSDFYGFQPYAAGLLGFATYWIIVCVILGWITVHVMHRGVAAPLWMRIQDRLLRPSPSAKLILGVAVMAWIGLGAYLAYNTHGLNRILGTRVIERRQVDYENQFRESDGATLPTITKVLYEIDIFPETRNLEMRGTQTLVNQSDVPIASLFINVDEDYENEIELEGAHEESRDNRLGYRVYRWDRPLEPKASVQMKFRVASKTRGIENNLSNPSIMPNGTFFNNGIAPSLGYDSNREVQNQDRRRNLGLPIREYPELTEEKGVPCQRHYIANASNWVEIETIVSTSADQIAVAPGSLVNNWTKNGRNYYQYRVDHPSLNFYSFISARYEVAREKWNDVDLEVYYLKEHAWNVPNMMRSMRQSLEYCSTHFGPYRHKQARIIEFPRVASFAQAFPGTMPYSESIGFIANLTDPEDIDMVFYVVAHEMAHQWWAHQIIGAKMQGATLLSETMAQYSALMVMEKEYGRDMMRKFLKYEMDRYLKARGKSSREEKPLLHVEPDQGYVHYNKGSVVLYYLKEMVGEERLNAAFKSLIDDFGYREPPYPNAYDYVKALKKHMPEELHPMLKDLFEDITIYGNRVIEASYKKKGDKYIVSLDIECHKYKAGEKGVESDAPLQDWIEIGAFAKPEPKKKYGATLYRKRVFIDQERSHHEFEVDALPDKVGVDPFLLLVDRMPDDNVKRPAEATKE
ncbi:MAG: M1 family aminopeptidase [Pirellulales bacterium]